MMNRYHPAPSGPHAPSQRPHAGYSPQGCLVTIHGCQVASDLTVSGYGKVLWAVDGGTLNHTTITSGGSAVVTQGGTSHDATVGHDGFLAVADGGTTSNTTVTAGGVEAVYCGGQTVHTALNGGDQYVFGGNTSDTTVGQGSTQYVFYGTAKGTEIGNGGTAIVSPYGTMKDTSVYSGGKLVVNYGASVEGTTLYNGGTIDLNFLRFTGDTTAYITNDWLVVTEDHARVYFKLADNYNGYSNERVVVSRDTDGNTLVQLQEVCFLPGSMIATPEGERAVETLEIGDVLLTANGETRPVTWVGRRSTRVRPGTLDDLAGYPVRIRAGAIADGVPHSDLLVTGEHCLFLEGGFIPVRMLINGTSIFWDRGITAYDYLHVETDGHAVILANGLATESYLDTGNRRSFAQTGRIASLGGAPKSWEQDAAAELVTDRARVEPVWTTIASRAGAAPVPASTTEDAALHLRLADGTLLAPRRIAGNRAVFTLPGGVENVRIVSRTSRPCDVTGPFLDDRRDLGVLVGEVTLYDSACTRQIQTHLNTADAEGWNNPEPGAHRWTAGDGILSIGTMTPATLAIQVLAAGPYLEEEESQIARRA
ncbi:Hint domain-containing protein [Gluconobacter morbifer]|uniref:Hedgehog/Intein (Hint) domain-containing protein n=1 Tax=Gluconobacter morbifer G707 TaxID=1088869 RepID=G6XGM0_9PROT|nr:Hint domain-containing protein [Gluconobacter morbifer]EHH69328.1 hypothetical protein GMO_06350 [Gluconobacter morbifer G707]